MVVKPPLFPVIRAYRRKIPISLYLKRFRNPISSDIPDFDLIVVCATIITFTRILSLSCLVHSLFFFSFPSSFNSLLSSLSFVKSVDRIAPRRNLERFHTHVGVLSHEYVCVSHAQPTSHVFHENRWMKSRWFVRFSSRFEEKRGYIWDRARNKKELDNCWNLLWRLLNFDLNSIWGEKN